MPRKTDPRSGEDGYSEGPEKVFDKEAARILIQEFAQDAEREAIDNLVEETRSSQQRYWRWKNRGAAAFSRAEARKSIELFLAGEFHTWAEIDGLNERARGKLLDNLFAMKGIIPDGSDRSVFQALLENQIPQEKIRMAASDALADFKAQKGPDSESVIPHIVARLCEIYEAMTGTPVTHSTRSRAADYTPDPQSHGGRFVLAMMRVIDSKTRDTRVASALRSVIEQRSRSR
ncbi:hypothetical protein [Henriciella sp.]|uniref:hypothetical protein n=1 Tax=Henriciella sp. TaxID=1968823 RepID=UPI0025BB8B46|nr:hypothetical protein [Henriciella sp.]